MLNYIKKKVIDLIIKNQVDKPIIVKKKDLKLNFQTNFQINTFGKKNPNKFFYVIRVDKKGGGGLFSNVLFILNHLIIADQHNFTPVVDMKNFPTRYNEPKKILSTLNSWEYYFKPISNVDLKDVYRSKNVIFTNGFINNDMSKNYKNNSNLKKVFKKYINIKKIYIKNVKNFENKYFKKNKVLGIHFRGTSMKTIPNHPLPPSTQQMFNLVDRALSKFKFTKIFLVTDQLDYLNLFIRKYGNKVCYRNSFRSNKSKIFHLTDRKLHRYKMGVDALEDTLLMSKLNYLICSRSNMSEVASLMLPNKLKVLEIKNGFNPNKILYSQINWYIRQFLPESFGGFKKRLTLKFEVNK